MNHRRLVFANLLIMVPVLVLLHGVQVLAQTERDSLMKLISTHERTTEQVDHLLKLADIFYDSNIIDSALYYAEKGRLLSASLGYAKGNAESYYMKSLMYYLKGNVGESLDNAREYLIRVKPLDDIDLLGKAYYQLGRTFGWKGEPDSAIFYIKKSLAIALQGTNNYRILANYNVMAANLRALSLFDSAAFYFLEGIRLAEQDSIIHALAKLYHNLGATKMETDDLEGARYYFDLALKYHDAEKDPLAAALMYNDLGISWKWDGDFEKALFYYDKASAFLEKLDNRTVMADLWNNYAAIYKEQENYPLAMKYLDRALEIFYQEGKYDGIFQTLKNKGEIYSALGQYSTAKNILDSAMAVAEDMDSKINQENAALSIAINYERMGDYKKAFEYQKRYTDLFMEVHDLERSKIIATLTGKYEKEKDQAEILALQNKNLGMELDLRKRTIQRNNSFYVIGGVLILTIFLILYFRQRITISRQKILQLEEEKKLMSARLLLEGQEQERKRIAQELHDGLGVLLSATKIQFTTLKDKSPENKLLIEKATQMLEQATGDVRKISHNMMPGLLTKLGLYEAIGELFDNINESEGVQAQLEIVGEQKRINENKEIMLYRILQELVNNTLRHADASLIQLKLKVFQEKLFLKYTDDGKGFDVPRTLAMEAGSFGLKSIQSRVNFLNGDLDIRSNAGEGVEFTLQIPI